MNVPADKIESVILTQQITNVKLYSGYSGNKLVATFPIESKTGKPELVADCINKMFKEFPSQITRIVGKTHYQGKNDQDLHYTILHQTAEVTGSPHDESVAAIEKRIRKQLTHEGELEKLKLQLNDQIEKHKPMQLVVNGLSQAFQLAIPHLTKSAGIPAPLNAPDTDTMDIDMAENVSKTKKEAQPEQAAANLNREQEIKDVNQAIKNFGAAGLTPKDLLSMSLYAVNNPEKLPMVKSFLGIS